MASPRRVAAKGVMAACVRVAVQSAVRAAATLCWRMAGACRFFARAKLLTKAAASTRHLPPTSIASTTNRQRFFAFAGILQSGPRDAESVSGNGVSLEALAGIVRQEINAAPNRSGKTKF